MEYRHYRATAGKKKNEKEKKKQTGSPNNQEQLQRSATAIQKHAAPPAANP